MSYPNEIDKFTEKLNKLENNTYVIEEEVTLTDGVYEGELQHDNVSNTSVRVYTGPKLTGEKIDNFILSTPSKTPWKREIKIFSKAPKVYITYETQGDTVEAEDINKVQESIVNTQIEAISYKASNNLEVGNLKVRSSNLENNKSEKTYVDTELNKRYLKGQVFTKEEVLQKIEELIGSAPEALDTLVEISKALGNDPDFAGTITKELANKVNKEEGKGLSTEDYTSTEKGKFAGIEDKANRYIHPSSHSADMIVENENKKFITDNEKTNFNEAYTKRHDHNNKTIIDNITKSLIDSWNSAVEHIKDNVKHITNEERTLWNKISDKAEKMHLHDEINISYNNEINIANGYTGGDGLVILNYRGTKTPIKILRVGNGQNNDLATIQATTFINKNGDEVVYKKDIKNINCIGETIVGVPDASEFYTTHLAPNQAGFYLKDNIFYIPFKTSDGTLKTIKLDENSNSNDKKIFTWNNLKGV